MSRTRLAAVAATLTCAFMLVGGTGIASAQTAPASQQLGKAIKVTGVTKSGKKLNAKYTIERFIAKGGKLYSVGTLTGKLRGKKVTKDNVRLPATVGNGSAARTSQVPLPPLPPGNACSILSLDLGPINLNLLGNLLCGLTGILNPSLANTPLGQLAQVLNALLALSPRTG